MNLNVHFHLPWDFCLSPQIEKEEEKVAQQDSEKQSFHLCIVNLVIGTLYCAKVSSVSDATSASKQSEPQPSAKSEWSFSNPVSVISCRCTSHDNYS